MYAVNTCIAQLTTYSETQSLQDYHLRKLITIHDDSIDELEIPEGNLEDIHLCQLKTFLRHEGLHYQNGYIYRIPGNNSTTGLRKAHFHTFVQFNIKSVTFAGVVSKSWLCCQDKRIG